MVYHGISFKDYITRGDVKETWKDHGAARAMFEKAQRRLKCIKSLTIDEECATFIFEDLYEVIRECAHSIMFADGYRTTDSHEACVAFINDRYKAVFGDSLVDDFDRYRKTRNDSKYRFSYVNTVIANEGLGSAEEFVRITALILNPKINR
ncbi:conserved hypothetical protein [Methanocella paludicola SANAE]|uniref:HEPN domain-containing protein n=1 Tax=Methanocella paludicola (strain DSM 17711 / JCM 13418 / NBRC 101707 / SANAE) TaxID=304371 RepID=D1YYI2_METPS|nr:hypothetical protein [Methanocella paludicola]BAI61504.1 conserved hypothetical protein [Methanocella paludicola SANAE]